MNGLNERDMQRVAMKRRLVAMTSGVVLIAGMGAATTAAATPVSLSNQTPSFQNVDQNDGSTFVAEDNEAQIISALVADDPEDAAASAQ